MSSITIKWEHSWWSEAVFKWRPTLSFVSSEELTFLHKPPSISLWKMNTFFYETENTRIYKIYFIICIYWKFIYKFSCRQKFVKFSWHFPLGSLFLMAKTPVGDTKPQPLSVIDKWYFLNCRKNLIKLHTFSTFSLDVTYGVTNTG